MFGIALPAGKTTQVRPSPMASLKMVLESALSQLGIKGADPSTCRLLLKDKPLDLSLPVRFANIPAGSKLVLLTGESGGGGG